MAESNKTRIQEFYASFQAARTDLTSRLEQFKAQASVPPDALNDFTLEVAKLRKELVDATSYLPPYDQRQYESFLKGVEQSIEQLRASAVQKPKFSFKRKIASTSSSTPTTVKTSHVAAPVAQELATASNHRIVSNKTKEYLSWSSIPSVTSSVSDLTISGLDQCILDFTSSDATQVQHKITALHVRNVTNSILIFPQVEGSALLHDLKRCIVVLGCYQFRMHSSSRINVYLSISSTPIIEHCTDIAFAAYPARFSQPSDSRDTSASQHLSVQDFSHIRATPSPNWRAMESDEALGEAEWPLSATAYIDESLERLLPQDPK